MRLTFQLRFHTHPGQSLYLTGNHEIFGNDDAVSAVPMQYLNDEFWRATLEIPAAEVPNKDITYRYVLRQADSTLMEDWGQGRVINPALLGKGDVLVIDSWNHPGFFENAFYTEPFREVLLRPRHTEVEAASPPRTTHQFKVKAPLLEKDQTLCLLGSASSLGSWNTTQPIRLNRKSGEDWLSVGLDLANENFPIEYKYGVYDTARKALIEYEAGANRRLAETASSSQLTIVNDGFAALPSSTWKGAGVAIPVFSLRSQASFGVGEFADLNLLADWCHEVGLKLIQILPVNDTSATHTNADSYPYAAISAFALHPLYVNLRKVASATNQHLLEEVEEERKRLNGLPTLEYETVMRQKLSWLRKLYQSQGKRTLKSGQYREFFKANQHWLVPYAAFCYLRDKYRTPDFNKWETLSSYDPGEVTKMAAEGSPAWDELALTFFIQYHLHDQLRAAKAYAHSKGVILKGDLPIGVYRNGVDAWQQPELYRMEMQAGAPPDAFGIKGQNWSFPTYNWERMKATGFAWWKQRFAQMGEYFDAFRIDHILGFFRIWSVPLHAVEGIMGYFVPALPVHVSEFQSRGIRFDKDRYTKPFITNQVLGEIFGTSEVERIKSDFLQVTGPDRYELRPEFATQRQVERYFAQIPAVPDKARIQEGLFDLISNVLLFEEERAPGEQFHFRFSIETTSSFRNLDPQTQNQLRELYVDYFFRRQEEFWRREAMQKLPPLKRVTRMLVCGEDLGMVPECVPDTMKQLGLLSLEVQRMPKRLNQEFSFPKDAPYLSVVTPSTHDMSTIRGWWKEDHHVTQRFYNHALGRNGPAPEDCETSITRAIIQQHLASPAMWSIFQLQDILGMDEHIRRPNPAEERINVPADAKNYWRYRMHLWLEDLLKATEFNHRLKQDINQEGR